MTTKIRLLPVIVLVLATAAPEAAQDVNRGGPEAVERFSRTVRLGPAGTFRLSNVSGDIVVTGAGGNEVRIEAVKRVRGRSDADARALLGGTEIVVREGGNRVEVRTEHNGRSRGIAVDYTISVPRDANVELNTVSGDVRVTDVGGELRAESVSGDIVASGALRLIALKSVSGDIELARSGSEASLTASTVSGDLVARGLKARALELESVSGGMRLDDVDAERARLRSVSGGIRYAGSLSRGGRYEITSHSGDISLSLPGSTGFALDVQTFSGRVRSDFPLPQNGQGDRGRNRTVRATFGDGGASLILQSFSGEIVLTRR